MTSLVQLQTILKDLLTKARTDGDSKEADAKYNASIEAFDEYCWKGTFGSGKCIFISPLYLFADV